MIIVFRIFSRRTHLRIYAKPSFYPDFQREFSMPQPYNLVHRTTNGLPFVLSAGAILSADSLRERVVATDAVEEAEGVANVALAARIGPNDHGERADAQSLVCEVLEIDEAEGRNHDAIPGHARVTCVAACVKCTIRSAR